MKRKRNILALGMITAFLLTGCRTTNDQTENEALKQQIAQLEQQIADLSQNSTSGQEKTPVSDTVGQNDNTSGHKNESSYSI